MITRLAPVAAALAAVAALAACSSGAGGSSTPEKGIGSTVPVSTAASSSSSGSPSAVAPTASSSSTAPGDFTDATYVTPSGFERSAAYAPAVPLETDYKAYFLVPTNAPTGRNLIAIYIYTLPADKGITASTDVQARIAAYNSKLKARVTYPVSTFSTPNLSGYRTYKEGVAQPPNFTYLAYFAFGAHHVMEFTCQYADPADLGSFATSCGKALGTVKLS